MDIAEYWPQIALILVLILLYREFFWHGVVARTRKEQYTCKLTGILNRAGLDLVGEQTLALYRREEYKSVTVVFIDLDDFKNVNDNLGHKVGDEALVLLSNILGERFRREVDVFGRYGGDEFVLVVPDWTIENVCMHLYSVRQQFEESSLKFAPTGMSFSIGACSTVEVVDGEKLDTLPDLCHEADRRMHADKISRGAGR